jgi:hypothetical protein
MIVYKLNPLGSFAQKIVDGIDTGEWANIETNQDYLNWVAEGNTPEAAS